MTIVGALQNCKILGQAPNEEVRNLQGFLAGWPSASTPTVQPLKVAECRFLSTIHD
jgi:hypothetical protein